MLVKFTVPTIAPYCIVHWEGGLYLFYRKKVFGQLKPRQKDVKVNVRAVITRDLGKIMRRPEGFVIFNRMTLLKISNDLSGRFGKSYFLVAMDLLFKMAQYSFSFRTTPNIFNWTCGILSTLDMKITPGIGLRMKFDMTYF